MQVGLCVGCLGMVVWTGVAAGAEAVATAPVVLVRDGVPAATLVLAAQPTRAAQLAAAEVRHYVQLISGARLPVVTEGQPVAGIPIAVGATEAARQAGLAADGFGPQEYAVRVGPGGVLLLGRDAPGEGTVTYEPDTLNYANLPGFWEERGTLNAAYDFLEKACGVRWLNPTDSGTVVPSTRTLAVPAMDLRRAPAFPFRDAIGAMGDNPGLYDEYTQFWARGSAGLKAWEEAAYGQPVARNPGVRRSLGHLFLLRMRNGGEIQRCNHSLYGYYERYWRRPEARRPEMFAKGYDGEPPQMCYTSRALIEQLAQDARDYWDGRKTGADLSIFWRPALPNWFPLEPMDNSSFCQCDACRAWLTRDDPGEGFSTGQYSDYFFTFVNEVAKALHQTHPGRGIVTLAYASHAAPPRAFPLDPGVAVQFCYSSNRVGQDPREIALLKAWSDEAKTSGRRLYLWLYDTFPLESARNANQHAWPGFFAHEIGNQMRLFRDLGYLGFFHCGFCQEADAYVTFRLMDDPGLDVDRLLDDYFGGLYGAAAAPMRRFYEAVEKVHLGKTPSYQPEQMTALAALMAQAQALASSEREKRNLALFDLAVWSYMQEGFRQRERVRSVAIPTVAVPRLAEAGGDAARLAWERAATLPGPWYRNNSDQPATHRLRGRVAHDGQYLYLELTDACDTAKLQSSAMVFPLDDWEVFVAGERGKAYRQYASNPHGLTTALSHGEVNFRPNVPIERPTFRVVSDTTAPDVWTTCMVWPLAEIVPGGARPGDPLYLNVVRVWALPGQTPDGSGIDAWGPFTRVHDVSRLPELRLE